MRPLLFLVVLLAVCPVFARAQPVSILVHQGRLLDALDQPVSGEVDITVRFHRKSSDAVGEDNIVWVHRYPRVAVRNGVYSIAIGDPATGGPALDLDHWDGVEQRWMGIAINDGDELQPRMRLTPMPFAVNATDALRLGGHPVEDFVLRSALSQEGTLNAPGNPVHWTKLQGVPPVLTEVTTSPSFTGNGTQGQPLGIASQGISSGMLAAGAVTPDKLAAAGCQPGQVLKRSLSTDAWVCADDNASVSANAPLEGNGTASSPLKVSAGGIASTHLADDAVTTAKLADGSVTAAKLADDVTGVPPGTILPYAGIAPPEGFLLCAGQAVSRTTYPRLFAALTVSLTGTTSGTQTLVTNVSSTNNLAVGMPISGPGIPSGTTIAGVSSSNSTITLSKAATTTTGNAQLVVAPYGVGNGSTNFNLPDLRGRVPAGLDSTTSRLTSNGAGFNGALLGAAGGAQTHALTTLQMPKHTHSMSHTHLAGSLVAMINHNDSAIWGYEVKAPNDYATNLSISISGTASNKLQSQGIGIIGNTGSASTSQTGEPSSVSNGTAHQNTQPTLIVNYIIKT